MQAGLHPKGKCRQSSSAERTLSREAASRSSPVCGFHRDRPWRKVVCERPSQGPRASPFCLILHRYAYSHMLRYVQVSSLGHGKFLETWLLGILIGVEVGAQGEPGTDPTGIFLNEFRYLL